MEITIRYEYIVDGVTEINLKATFDPGDLFTHGDLPAATGRAGVR